MDKPTGQTPLSYETPSQKIEPRWWRILLVGACLLGIIIICAMILTR
jgi:hypothetical protein